MVPASTRHNLLVAMWNLRAFADLTRHEPKILMTSDTLERLATDGSDRMSKFVLPAIRANSAAGRPVRWGGAAVACWKRCYENENGTGARIGFIDAFADELRSRANVPDDLEFLRQDAIFGDIISDAAFVAAYRSALQVLRTDPVSHGIERLSAG